MPRMFHVCYVCFFMARNLQIHINFPSLKSHSKFYSGIQMGIFCKQQNSSEKSLPFHIDLKIEMFREGIGCTSAYISHTSCRQKRDFIYTLQYVDKDRVRDQASCLSHHDLFTVNFSSYGHRSSVRRTKVTQLTHIQKHRIIIISLPANVAEDRWWKAEQTGV